MIGALVLGGMLLASAPAAEPRAVESVARWTSNGPYGGAIYATAEDPQNGIAYAGTAHGLYRALDDSSPWTRLPLKAEAVSQVIIDPADASVLWAATLEPLYDYEGEYYVELHRSADKGQTWTDVLSSGPGLAVALDPIHSGTVYAAAYSRLRKTTDGGATWVDLPLEWVTSVAIDASDPSRVYAATRAPSAVTTALFVSADGGASWRATGFEVPEGFSVFADPTAPHLLYALNGRLRRSDDGGATWSDHTPVPPPDRAGAFGIDARVPGRLILATTERAVYESFDRGGTWRSVASLPARLSALAGTAAGGIRAASYDRGLFISDPLVRTWSFDDDGILAAAITTLALAPSDPHVAYALGSGFSRTQDGGESWTTDAFAPTTNAIAVDPFHPEIVYASGSAGDLLKSGDGGRSWAPTFRAEKPVGSIAIDPTDSAVLYAVAQTAGVFDGSIWRSTDGGGSWNALGALSGVGFVRTITGSLWASNGELYRSDDRGETWTRTLSSTDTQSSFVLDFAVDPRNPGTLYAATYGEIFKSSDGGSHWTKTTTPPIYGIPEGQSIDCGSSGDLYVVAFAAGYHGIESIGPPYRSTDGGATWQVVRVRSPNALIAGVPQEVGGRLLLPTDQGVWSTALRPLHALPPR